MCIETEIKKLRFRANHRGIKEMDIILGGFADERLHQLDKNQIHAFAKLLEENDQDLLKWFTGEIELDRPDLNEIFQLILSHARLVR